MSGEEMLVIVAGLFFGYLVVTFIMEKNNNISRPQPKKENGSNSFKENATNEKSTQQDNYQRNSSNRDYIATSWYHILEVSELASLSDITTQYKRKIREYHPDKVASLGKELRELAEFKSKEINLAYEYAKSIK